MLSKLATWICKNLPQWHKNWNLIHSYRCNINATLHWLQDYLDTPNIAMTINSQVYFHRWLFADPVKPWRQITGPMEPVNGSNKDMCGAKLLKTTVSAYPVGYVCSVTYWRHSTTAGVLMEGTTHLQLPTLPHHPPHPAPYTCHLWYYSCCE